MLSRAIFNALVQDYEAYRKLSATSTTISHCEERSAQLNETTVNIYSLFGSVTKDALFTFSAAIVENYYKRRK